MCALATRSTLCHEVTVVSWLGCIYLWMVLQLFPSYLDLVSTNRISKLSGRLRWSGFIHLPLHLGAGGGRAFTPTSSCMLTAVDDAWLALMKAVVLTVPTNATLMLLLVMDRVCRLVPLAFSVQVGLIFSFMSGIGVWSLGTSVPSTVGGCWAGDGDCFCLGTFVFLNSGLIIVPLRLLWLSTQAWGSVGRVNDELDNVSNVKSAGPKCRGKYTMGGGTRRCEGMWSTSAWCELPYNEFG
jgi:hypothetical protein